MHQLGRAACVLFIAVIAALGCGGPHPHETEEPSLLLVESGRANFERYCVSCHGTGGRGDGPVAGSLTPPPADLTRIAARRGGVFPAAEIAAYVDGRTDVSAHGSRSMPVWGRRFGAPIAPDSTAEEAVRGHLLVLVEYLKTLQRE